jgi:uncharacterized protein (TIGR03000 family)
MLRQRLPLMALAVAGLAVLLAPRPASAQYPVGDRASVMSTGGSYYVSRGPGYSAYTPAPNLAGRYDFYPGMYTGDYRPSRFATSSGYYATSPSGYPPVFLTSLHYPGIYGSYTNGIGTAATVNVATRFHTTLDNAPSDNTVGAPYAPLQRPLAEVPLKGVTELSTRPAPASRTALIDVFLPADATLTFQDELTTETGPVRAFQSPPLEPGRTYTYDIRATWRGEGGRPAARKQRVTVRAGDHVEVDFNKDVMPRAEEPENERPMLRTQPLPLLRQGKPESRP